jgi:hypothetical protein
MNNFVINCPHCDEHIFIEQLNCCIFRHGHFKLNNEQIDQHSSKELCDNYVNQNIIYGCGKPFKITVSNDKYIVEKCDYI